MTRSVSLSRWISFWIVSVVIGSASGLAYAALFENGKPILGVIVGITTCALLLGFDRQLILPRLQQRIKRYSAPIYGVASVVIMVALIVLANIIAGSFVLAVGLDDEPFWEAVIPTPRVLSYSLMVAAIISFLMRMRDLIGGEMFFNLLIGRYHKPVEEERIFLFIDLVGSTSIAERMGPMRYQEFLGRFFAGLAEPVRACQGSLDDYIGDMAMVTWPLIRGLREARCLRCVELIREEIDGEADRWMELYGVRPDFRAVLHCGPVVTAEIGVEKHKITYFGDTVNTTARMEELAKHLREPLLISSDLLERLGLTADARVRDLGAHAVRGRDEVLRVAAVD
ncbi:adenylate/guanylate cyclase domain-containing protein [Microvirga pudoricolor]|uniref:adenylate/guanylate cyclase domain-containing protein n=1 Tax=Microvirga pudoricolor TaxID=2778729 RepID=UPI0019521909|nr:adenylate/guanylate cyclase domain-containing protein [Microvirga pudoricolor]MBM6595862.1 adenylate/guanylate cyclase domain-containing protein [Microvirga pudoricolor]